MKNYFTYPSKDNQTNIHAIEWKPSCQVKAVVQIIHGMVEFMDRYDRFANFLTDHGYYVIGHDNLDTDNPSKMKMPMAILRKMAMSV